MSVLPTLSARRDPLASGTEQVRLLERLPGRRFDEALAASGPAGSFPMRATGLSVLQVNVGKLCNQTCRHCHVDAGPTRTESMTEGTARLCLDVLARTDIATMDVTGGAPEMSPCFRLLVREARALGRRVVDRCNLTVLLLPAQGDLAEFLAEHRVEIVASLPATDAARTDAQRGEGVFEKSIRALRRLNDLGYGRDGTGLSLTLVHNPVGAFLPPDQQALEARTRLELERRFGVTFNALYTITNMPISRYLEWLKASGNLESYMERLANAFNPAAVAGVMCRTTLSVGWDGTLYDCDFNQMLELPTGFSSPRHIRDFDASALANRRIVTARHCFGCTAGAGSSCGGATVSG